MKPAPGLISVATAVPPHVVRQEDAKRFVSDQFDGAGDAEMGRLLGVFDHSAIVTRHVCMPLEWYARDHDFGERNDRYVEHALGLGSEAARRALGGAGLEPEAVDHLVFVSSTGLATPSLDARLATALGCRPDARRTPVWGLGCAGGVAGLARAREFATADPGAHVLVIALELCSLAFQRRDRSKRELVAASLFADGAAAAVVSSAPRADANGAPRLELAASGGTLWPDTTDVMGWNVDGEGLHVVFSRDIPSFIREHVGASLDGFLAAHGLDRSRVDHVVAHPGGPKVLAAYEETLRLGPDALRHARAVLRDHGNMSSPTCLFVLERLLQSGDIRRGDTAVVTALGPGFAAEYVLLEAPPG